jgi:hypothetical protein
MRMREIEPMASEYIEEFNALLHGEIGAVETYNVAMKHASGAEVVRTLESAKQSHVDRVNKLRSHVIEQGGKPDETAGLWGPFEKFVQGTAHNEHDTVAMLEEAEAERLVNYESQRTIVQGEVLSVVINELLPAQHESHLMISSLLKQISPIPQA